MAPFQTPLGLLDIPAELRTRIFSFLLPDVPAISSSLEKLFFLPRSSIMTPFEPHFRIMDLPAELHTHILSFVLPDLPVIRCDMDWSPCADDPPRGCSPATWNGGWGRAAHDFRADREPCCTEILRVNNKLYQEGRRYLYGQKTYKISVFDFGFDFLDHLGFLEKLPPVPYHMMKEFVIQIAACSNLSETGYRLRSNLVWLCGLLAHEKIHFRKLRVEFQEQDRGSLLDSCGLTWDSEQSDQPFLPNPTSDSHYDLLNINLQAYEQGFPSTFAYVLSALAMLGPIAESCTVEVPTVFRENQHVVELAKWYEEGVNGTYPFDDNGVLRQDRAEFEYSLANTMP